MLDTFNTQQSTEEEEFVYKPNQSLMRRNTEQSKPKQNNSKILEDNARFKQEVMQAVSEGNDVPDVNSSFVSSLTQDEKDFMRNYYNKNRNAGPHELKGAVLGLREEQRKLNSLQQRI
jgi:hypothetical protein